jgi:hypothetical protein
VSVAFAAAPVDFHPTNDHSGRSAQLHAFVALGGSAGDLVELVVLAALGKMAGGLVLVGDDFLYAGAWRALSCGLGGRGAIHTGFSGCVDRVGSPHTADPPNATGGWDGSYAPMASMPSVRPKAVLHFAADFLEFDFPNRELVLHFGE